MMSCLTLVRRLNGNASVYSLAHPIEATSGLDNETFTDEIKLKTQQRGSYYRWDVGYLSNAVLILDYLHYLSKKAYRIHCHLFYFPKVVSQNQRLARFNTTEKQDSLQVIMKTLQKRQRKSCTMQAQKQKQQPQQGRCTQSPTV
jgi:hypothetical protein